MFKNYLKIAFRNLVKHKAYSFINITGLAMGMACIILIFLYVQDEFKYDKYHQKGDRIYRLVNKATQVDYASAIQPAIQLPYLQNEFPEIEKAIRIIDYGDCVISSGDKRFVDGKFMFADPDIFAIFSFPFVMGEPDKALANPFSLVLTEKAAKKYFGDENPMGATLKVDNEYDFTVTGVLKDIPYYSHFRFNFLASFSSYKDVDSYMLENWYASGTYQYLLLREHVDKAMLESKFPAFLEKHRGSEYASSDNLLLEPLSDIHLHSSKTRWDIADKGDIVYVYGFIAIACLILLLACFNFMNLATARSNLRIKEVGVRKVVGANRWQLVAQFLGESFCFVLLAMLVAWALVELFLPLFNHLYGKNLQTNYLSNWLLTFGVASIAFLVTILAGSYPAFFISNFKPNEILKGVVTPSGLNLFIKDRSKLRLRQFLVILQFAVSIALVVCTLLIVRQMRFISNSKLGFDKENVIIVKNPISNMGDMNRRFERFKNSILQNPRIKAVSAADNVPPGNINNYTNARLIGQAEDEAKHFGLIAVEHEFLKAIGAEFVAGRNFSRKYASDPESAIVLNESAVRELGLVSPVGAQLIGINNTSGPQTIIGVVKDMHYKSMHELVEPTIFYQKPWSTSSVVIRMNSQNISSTIKDLQQQWEKLTPEWPFQYNFLDQEFNNLYRAEERTTKLLGTLTLLAIFISCLGLLGLVALDVTQRTKEVGIRKVLGATVANVVALLSKDFVKLVLLSNVIAWPVAWWAMNKWLQNFAYRIGLSWWVFALAGGLALVIALLTVSTQAIKAALANPVESLRYE